MGKVQKNFRMTQNAIMDLAEIKEVYAMNGLRLTDVQIVEYAIEKLWMEKGGEDIDLLKRRTSED